MCHWWLFLYYIGTTFFKQQFLCWIFFLAPVLEIYKEDFCCELVGPINIKVVTTPLIYLKILCIKQDHLSIKKKERRKEV